MAHSLGIANIAISKHPSKSSSTVTAAAASAALPPHALQHIKLEPTTTTPSPYDHDIFAIKQETAHQAAENDEESPLPRRVKGPACEPCRKRKVRCDGAVPCGACEKSRLKCQYPPSKPIGRSKPSLIDDITCTDDVTSTSTSTSISSSTSSSISTSSSASSSTSSTASTQQSTAPSTATSTSTPYHFIPNNLQHHQHHHHPQPHPPMATTTTTTQTTTPMVVVMAPHQHQQYQSHPPSQPPTLAPSLMHASFIPSSNVVFSTPSPSTHLPPPPPPPSSFMIDPHLPTSTSCAPHPATTMLVLPQPPAAPPSHSTTQQPLSHPPPPPCQHSTKLEHSYHYQEDNTDATTSNNNTAMEPMSTSDASSRVVPASHSSDTSSSPGSGSDASPMPSTALDEFEELVPLETRLFLLDFARTRQPVEFAGIERLFAPRKIGDLDASSALWLRMTFYSLMAIVSRMSRRSTYENLIADRIRWLARQLFDQPHPGTAAAFLFAAHYFSIVSDEVSDYYARVFFSMWNQLRQRYVLCPPNPSTAAPHSTSTSPPPPPPLASPPPFSIDSADFLLQLQIYATGISGVRSAPWKIQLLESTLQQLTQLSQDDITPIAAPYQLHEMRFLLLMRLKIAQALNRVVIGRDILMSELQLSHQEATTLLWIRDLLETSREFQSWNQWVQPMVLILSACFRVLVYIASRQYEACLALVRVVLTMCETHQCHFEHAQPMLPELMFWMVHVCRTLNQPLLARRAVSILEKLVQVYTAGAQLYRDVVKLVPPLPPLSLRRGEGAFASQLNNRDLFLGAMALARSTGISPSGPLPSASLGPIGSNGNGCGGVSSASFAFPPSMLSTQQPPPGIGRVLQHQPSPIVRVDGWSMPVATQQHQQHQHSHMSMYPQQFCPPPLDSSAGTTTTAPMVGTVPPNVAIGRAPSWTPKPLARTLTQPTMVAVSSVPYATQPAVSANSPQLLHQPPCPTPSTCPPTLSTAAPTSTTHERRAQEEPLSLAISPSPQSPIDWENVFQRSLSWLSPTATADDGTSSIDSLFDLSTNSCNNGNNSPQ